MKLEHFAFQVPDPAAMADWYVRHLGFSVARTGGPPGHARFLLEEAGSVMIEIYRNPKAPVPDYSLMDPLLLHLAFVSDQTQKEVERLCQAGARLVEEPVRNLAGDELVMLRDPWGVALQLVKRARPMLKNAGLRSRRRRPTRAGA